MTRNSFIIGVIGMLLGVLVVGAAPIYSMLGMKNEEVLGGEKGPTAADYVQEGLVALYDAIENVGWEVHDSQSPVWVDLVGGGIIRKPKNYTFSWGDDVLYYAAMTSNPTYAIDVAAGCSVEGVYRGVWGGNWPQPVLLYIRHSDGDLNCGFLGVSNIRISRNWNQFVEWRAAAGSGERVSIRAMYDGESLSFSFNDMRGEVFSKQEITATSVVANLCRDTSKPREVNCIRIYNRVLTEEEVMHNYEVDRIRFNLP